jgi:hypothetical protein
MADSALTPGDSGDSAVVAEASQLAGGVSDSTTDRADPSPDDGAPEGASADEEVSESGPRLWAELAVGLAFAGLAVFVWWESAHFIGSSKLYVRTVDAVLGVSTLAFLLTTTGKLILRRRDASSPVEKAPPRAALPRRKTVVIVLSILSVPLYAIGIQYVGWFILTLVFLQVGFAVAVGWSAKRFVIVSIVVISVWVLAVKALLLDLPAPLGIELPFGLRL